MSCKSNFVLGLAVTLTFGFLSLGVTENSHAQLFRANSRYCPQPVVVRPNCPPVQYYVPTRSFFQTQPGYTLVPIQFATPMISTPGYVAVPPGSYNVAPLQTATGRYIVEGSGIPQNVQTGSGQVSASNLIAPTADTVAPAVPVEPVVQTQTNAPFEPVPTNDAATVKSEEPPPTAEAPKPEKSKIAEPTPATSKSILKKDN